MNYRPLGLRLETKKRSQNRNLNTNIKLVLILSLLFSNLMTSLLCFIISIQRVNLKELIFSQIEQFPFFERCKNAYKQCKSVVLVEQKVIIYLQKC